jgi:hypothetical protein
MITLAVDKTLNCHKVRVYDSVLKELDLIALREYWGLVLLVHKYLTCAGMSTSVHVAILSKVKFLLGPGKMVLCSLVRSVSAMTNALSLPK